MGKNIYNKDKLTRLVSLRTSNLGQLIPFLHFSFFSYSFHSNFMETKYSMPHTSGHQLEANHLESFYLHRDYIKPHGTVYINPHGAVYISINTIKIILIENK